MPINKSKIIKGGISTVQQMTTWRNDTKDTITFILFPPGNMNMRDYQNWEVVLNPGEEVAIPSEHDHVIQQMHPKKPTLVMGGLAPQLTNISKAKKVKLHDSINVELQEKKANLKKVVEIQMQRKMMDEALRMSQAEMANVLESDPLSSDKSDK